MQRRVDLYYDIVSPYTWLGFELLCRYRSVWDLQVGLRPMLLGAVLKGAANRIPKNSLSPSKAAYTVLKDLPHLGRHFGVPLRPESLCDPWLQEAMFRKGTLSTMRFLTAVQARQPDAVESVSRLLFQRLFCQRADIAEPASLREAAERAGLSAETAEAALADAGSDAVKAKLKATTEEALALGAFGTPTFIVHTKDGGKEMVFGSDRFHIIGDLLGCKYTGPLTHLSQTPMS